MKLDKSKWNGCPIRYSAEILGDKWTFLILRDLMFRGKSSYNALLKSSEKISTNILADRLRKLEEHGVLKKNHDLDNKKQYVYTLTDMGQDLMPMMLYLFEWSFKYDKETYLPEALINKIKKSPEEMIKSFREGNILVLDSRET